MRKLSAVVLCVFLFSVVFGSVPFQKCASAAESPATITVDPSETGEIVSPDLFGYVMNWSQNGEGAADPKSGKAYDSFVEMCKRIGVSSIRYGGGTISATCFDWKRAIGPMEDRGENRVRDGCTGQPSTFGPDEIGDLIERVGCEGDMTMNTNRDTLESNWQYMAYLTLPVDEDDPAGDPEDPNYWAQLRAKNGHYEPYHFTRFDVGNEEDMFKRWRVGKNIETVEINDHDTKVDNDNVNLYAFGGETRITKEATVGYADLDTDSGISKGTPEQTFYVQYPSVAENSQTVYVDGDAWEETGNLSGASPEDKVYTFDDTLGKITFGDGTNGMIPPKDAAITATYTTTHPGYVDYYEKFKEINPKISVESELDGEDFAKAMGTIYPYDTVDYHPFGDGMPNKNLDELEYTKQLFLAPIKQRASMAERMDYLKKYSGREIPLTLKAYGRNNTDTSKYSIEPYTSLVDGEPHLFEVEGLVNAALVISYQNVGIKTAHRFLLNETPFSPDTNDAPSARRFSAAIISSGDDDNFILTPVGLAMEIMSKLSGKTQIGSDVQNNPQVAVEADPGHYDSLNTIAAKDDDGNVDLVVINQNISNDGNVAANIDLSGFHHLKFAQVMTMDGKNYNSEVTLDDPDAVTNTINHVNVGTGNFKYTFPAHSITKIRLLANGSADSVSDQIDGMSENSSSSEIEDAVLSVEGLSGSEQNGLDHGVIGRLEDILVEKNLVECEASDPDTSAIHDTDSKIPSVPTVSGLLLAAGVTGAETAPVSVN